MHLFCNAMQYRGCGDRSFVLGAKTREVSNIPTPAQEHAYTRFWWWKQLVSVPACVEELGNPLELAEQAELVVDEGKNHIPGTWNRWIYAIGWIWW